MLLDTLVENWESIRVGRTEPVLVADLDVFNLEWFGVPVSSQSAIMCVGINEAIF